MSHREAASLSESVSHRQGGSLRVQLTVTCCQWGALVEISEGGGHIAKYTRPPPPTPTLLCAGGRGVFVFAVEMRFFGGGDLFSFAHNIETRAGGK